MFRVFELSPSPRHERYGYGNRQWVLSNRSVARLYAELHGEVKLRSYAGLAFYRHTSPYHLRQAPGDGQAEAGSAKVAGCGCIGLAEGIKDHV